MPQQIVVDSNGGIRTIEVGPRGPAGPSGVGNVEGAGYIQDGVLHIPTDDSPDVGSARSLGLGEQQAAPGNVLSLPSVPGGATLKPELYDWFSKFSEAKTTPVEIVWITDSIGAIGDTDDPGHPWLTSRMLNNIAGGRDYRLPVFAQSGDGGAVPVATSTDGTGDTIGLGAHSSVLADGDIVTHVEDCLGWRLTYVDSGTGSLTIRNGAGGTILDIITFTNTGELKLWKSDPITYGTNTLHITSSGTTNVGQIIPINNSAVISYMATHSGYKSSNFSLNPSIGLDLIEYLNDSVDHNLAMVVIATGANDTPYSTMMPALIDAVKAVYDGDIVLWVPYISGAVNQAEYDAMHPVALASGLPLIDSSIYFSKFADTYTIDGTHPITSGKQILAEFNTMVLSGNPIGYLTKELALKPSLGEASTDAAPGNLISAIQSSQKSIEDDFILGVPGTSGSIGELGWVRTNGVSSSPSLQLNGHPGAVRIQTNASTQFVSLNLPTNGSIFDNNGVNWRMAFWVRNGSPTSLNRWIIGLVNTGDPLHGLYFEKPLGGGYWDIVHEVLGTEVARTTTAITMSTNIWSKFEILKFGTSVLYLINNTIAGLVPNAGSFGTFGSATPAITVYANDGTAQYLDIDRFQLGLSEITRQGNGT